MKPVDPSNAEQQLRSVQALYRRTLSSWASDLLTLRREGLMLARWVDPMAEPDTDSNRRVA